MVDKGSEYELIAPCQCKGTMRWVHRMCLNTWRAACYRTDAYYLCEQCQSSYEIESGWGASLLNNRTFLKGMTVLGLAACIGLAGMAVEVAKETVGPAWEGVSPLEELLYNINVRSDPYLTKPLCNQTLNEPSYSDDDTTSRRRTLGEQLKRLWPRIILSIVVTSFLEFFVVNFGPGALANLGIATYRHYFSDTNILDKVAFTGVLAYGIYYIYQDVHWAVAAIIRFMTSTRVRNRAED